MPPDVAARFKIISGERDAARQAEVNPGVTDSRHMHGMAVDLANDPAVIQWITQHPQYGVGFPLTYMGPKEYNHMEMIDPVTQQRVGMDYAATGDPNFKTGLRPPTAPSPDIGGTAGLWCRQRQPRPRSMSQRLRRAPRHKHPPPRLAPSSSLSWPGAGLILQG